MQILAITDNQLTIIITSIPTTIAALGAFIATLKGNKDNRKQHDEAIARIETNQAVLVDHAAKMGTLERRHVDRTTGQANTNVMAGDSGSTEPPKQAG